MSDDPVKQMAEHFRQAEARRTKMKWVRDNPHSSIGRASRLLTFVFASLLYGGTVALFLVAANWLDIHVVGMGAEWLPVEFYLISSGAIGCAFGWKASRPYI